MVALGLLLLCSLVIPASAEYVFLGGDPPTWIDMDTGTYLTEEEYYALFPPEDEVSPSEDANEDAGAEASSPIDDDGIISDGEEAQDETVQEVVDTPALLSAYDAADYSLGTSNISIFSGLVSKVPWGQHYVYWRDSQYTYKFAYGSLELNGTSFSGGSNDITVITYNTENYNSSYYWTVAHDSAFSLSAGNRLVYSDLGNYPGLADKEVTKYATVSAFVLCAFAFWGIGSRLRNACIR